jgi:hypothetical protein
MAAPEKLAALRHLLAERFPTVPCTARSCDGLPPAPGLRRAGRARVLPTGIPAVDDVVGGIPLSAVTEIVCAAPSCGSQLFIGQLLAGARAAHNRVAVIDSTDSFDAASFAGDLLAHVVWVRCRTTAEALQAADLLTRDANLGLVLLDLRRAPLADLRHTPATQWYRLQRAVEPADLALVVETPHASVPSAQLRLALDTPQPAAALDRARSAAAAELLPRLQRRRIAANS